MPTPDQIAMAAVAETIGEQKQTNAQEQALADQEQAQADILAEISAQLQSQQAQAQPLLDQAQAAQAAQLGLLGMEGGDQGAAQALISSPLMQAVNAQSQRDITAQAAASGVSGGNLLQALQQSNQANLLNAGFAGLGQIGGQSGQLGLGLSGMAQNTFGLGVGQQQNLAQANLAQTLFKGQQAASPFLNYSQGIQQQQDMLGNAIGLGASLYNPFQPKDEKQDAPLL